MMPTIWARAPGRAPRSYAASSASQRSRVTSSPVRTAPPTLRVIPIWCSGSATPAASTRSRGSPVRDDALLTPPTLEPQRRSLGPRRSALGRARPWFLPVVRPRPGRSDVDDRVGTAVPVAALDPGDGASVGPAFSPGDDGRSWCFLLLLLTTQSLGMIPS